MKAIPMPNKLIFSVSLESVRKYKACAFFDAEGRLTVTHCLPIKGTPSEWRSPLLAEIEEKAGKGFAILVEDRTNNFSHHAISFNFDEVGEEGRTMLQHCLDWYFSMDSVGNLILDKSVEPHAIRGGGEMAMVNFSHDEKGRLVYYVDWNKLAGGHKALLMCVAGAVMELPLSGRWMKDFTAAFQAVQPSPVSPLSSFFSITTGYDAFRQRAFEESVRTGKPLPYPR